MSDNDIFKADTVNTENPDTDFFAELVGEEKRFKSPQELAKGKIEADAFIEKLQTETAELRAELEKRVTFEELMDQIKQPSSGNATSSTGENQQTRETPPADGFSPEKIQALVDAKMSERSEQERRANNARAVKERLQQEFGRDYPSRLEARAKDLQTSKEYLQELSETNPTMFFELLGRPQQDRNPSPPRNQVNTGSFTPQSTDKNYSYFSEMRKKDPKTYFTPRVQQELMREAKRQGEAFYR